MAKAGVGIDIGSSGVRVAAVRQSKRGPELIAFREALVDSADHGSDFIDPRAVTAVLKQLTRGLKLPSGEVALGLSNQRMVAREVEIPWVPSKELASALPHLVSDLLPMPVEDSVLDFLPFEEVIEDDGSRLLRGLLVAANEEMVTTAVEAVQRAGMNVGRVDFSPLAALHSVCDPTDIEAEAVVDVGATSTSLVVREGNRPTFVRVMSRGGDSITEVLADELSLEEQQAEAWKTHVGQMWPTMSAQDQARTRQLLDEATSGLIDDVRSSLNFHRSNGGGRVARVWLIGGGGRQFGLDYQLREALRVHVLRGQPLTRLAAIADAEVRDQAVYVEPEAATAVGLALAVAS